MSRGFVAQAYSLCLFPECPPQDTQATRKQRQIEQMRSLCYRGGPDLVPRHWEAALCSGDFMSPSWSAAAFSFLRAAPRGRQS